MMNLSLPELIQTVNAQERIKKDHLVESHQLSVVTRDNQTYLTVPGRNSESYVLNDTARAQLATRLEIPYRYAEKLRMEEPRLLDQNLNALLRRKTLRGGASPTSTRRLSPHPTGSAWLGASETAQRCVATSGRASSSNARSAQRRAPARRSNPPCRASGQPLHHTRHRPS